MIDTKPIFQSKTVWGGVAVILSQLAHIAGYSISDADSQTVVEDISTACTILSALFTIWGRVRATKALTVKPAPQGQSK